MDATRGSGNVNVNIFSKPVEVKQDNALQAKLGSPQNETTEFKGMSLANKIKKLSEGVSELNTKLNLKTASSDSNVVSGNVLRRDLDQLAKLNRPALSADQAKLLEDSISGKMARRDASKWGKDDIKATIDMSSTEDNVSQLEQWTNLDKLQKQELTIMKTSHQILNKLFENW